MTSLRDRRVKQAANLPVDPISQTTIAASASARTICGTASGSSRVVSEAELRALFDEVVEEVWLGLRRRKVVIDTEPDRATDHNANDAEWLSEGQAAQLAKRSKSCIKKWRLNGDIFAVKRVGRWEYQRSSLLKHLGF